MTALIAAFVLGAVIALIPWVAWAAVAKLFVDERFQFVVWWPEVARGASGSVVITLPWMRFGLERLRYSESAWALLYRWRLYLGWLEVRRRAPREDTEDVVKSVRLVALEQALAAIANQLTCPKPSIAMIRKIVAGTERTRA